MLRIRRAQPGDAERLTALAQKTYVTAFGHSFTPPDLAAHLETELSAERIAAILLQDIVLVAEVDEQLVGFLQCGSNTVLCDGFTVPEQEVRRLYVDAALQNQGIGARLMAAALALPDLQEAAAIVLDVWEHNPAAQRFYARYGFEVVGARAFVVASGAETSRDLIMVRRSPGVPAAGGS
jgi:ribosomal protein S18 acetylase RimI-like enzyme